MTDESESLFRLSPKGRSGMVGAAVGELYYQAYGAT